MEKNIPFTEFDLNAPGYDAWFERHKDLYEQELAALKEAIRDRNGGVDIGAGTGRFTKALGMAVAVEPSVAMARLAIDRGIPVINSEAEQLPFHDGSFPVALMVTTDCFLKDVPKAFREVYRILQKDGIFVMGMIDRESELGKSYEARKSSRPWYAAAHFHTVAEITGILQQSGFRNFTYWQTLLPGNRAGTNPLPGYGEGSFVVIRTQKN
jgi:ubiquinone/menaquinone biosynthesis C-methylase UbiE